MFFAMSFKWRHLRLIWRFCVAVIKPKKILPRNFISNQNSKRKQAQQGVLSVRYHSILHNNSLFRQKAANESSVMFLCMWARIVGNLSELQRWYQCKLSHFLFYCREFNIWRLKKEKNTQICGLPQWLASANATMWRCTFSKDHHCAKRCMITFHKTGN